MSTMTTTKFRWYPCASSVCVQKTQSIYSMNAYKRSDTILYNFMVFISVIRYKIYLDSFKYWLSEKLNYVSEVSSGMLLGFLFTFLFIVNQAISMPIAWAFSKARLKDVLVICVHNCKDQMTIWTFFLFMAKYHCHTNALLYNGCTCWEWDKLKR